VRWFKVDSDWSDEDRIVRILERMEQAAESGVGAGPPEEWVQAVTHGVLVDLWALAARQEGARLPGYMEEREGRPLSLAKMAKHCGVPRAFVEQLLEACAAEGHINAERWAAERLVIFPGMIKRADVYTQRRLRRGEVDERPASGADTVRTDPVEPEKLPLPSESTSSRKKKEKGPALPLAGADQVEALVKVWNEGTTHPLPKVDLGRLSDSRRRTFARELVRTPNLDDWRQAVAWLNRQTWCRRPGFLADGKPNTRYEGKHPNFTADLDWLCKDGRLQKSLEKLKAEAAPAGATGTERRKYGGIGS